MQLSGRLAQSKDESKLMERYIMGSSSPSFSAIIKIRMIFALSSEPTVIPGFEAASKHLLLAKISLSFARPVVAADQGG